MLVWLLAPGGLWAATAPVSFATARPYAGYATVLSALGEQVLGPAATAGVQAMLEADQPPLPRGCVPGDTELSARSLRHQVRCADHVFAVTLRLRAGAPAEETAALTARFALGRPEVSPGACLAACADLRQRVLSAVAARVRARETGVTLQPFEHRQGARHDGWRDALVAARTALMTGDAPRARQALKMATRARVVGRLSAVDAFDLALFARAAADPSLVARAVQRARTALADRQTSQGPVAAGIRVALPLLDARGQEGLPGVHQCADDPMRCDVLPAVRTLAACGRFADAAEALDRGPLARGAPPAGQELWLLRLGLAGVTGDTTTRADIARRLGIDLSQAVDGPEPPSPAVAPLPVPVADSASPTEVSAAAPAPAELPIGASAIGDLALAPAPGPAETPDDPRRDGTGGTTLPIAILLALLAAVAVRAWGASRR